jgi:serine/threonine protein kinase
MLQPNNEATAAAQRKPRQSRIKRIKDYDIQLDKMIGKGAFSKVYQAENTKTKQTVAIKEISNAILMQQLGD